MRFNTYYQTISGREQQRQFAYFEVPAGQGFYSWQDYNGNGIREINEFEQSPFQDQAKFVRLLIPTGQYVTSQASEFNGNFSKKGLDTTTNIESKITRRNSEKQKKLNNCSRHIFRTELHKKRSTFLFSYFTEEISL